MTWRSSSTHHNGVNCTYPCTGQHGVDQLWDHGEVDGNPVAFPDTCNHVLWASFHTTTFLLNLGIWVESDVYIICGVYRF